MPSEPHSASAPANDEFYGRFSDGRTAAASDASVRLGLSGVEVALAGGGRRFIWPYDSLHTLDPLRPHSVDVLLSSTSDAGASLFVQGPVFASTLATRAPALTAKAHRWRKGRPWLIAAALAAVLITAAGLSGWSPAGSMARLLPESWRDRLGDAAMSSMVEGRKRCTDAAGQAALERLARRLDAASGDNHNFKITVVDWDLINAFAVPGNRIVVTKGLIEKAAGADEVAGVVAHEMGHGIALHPETGIVRAVGLSAVVELMMGGAGGTIANLGLVLAQLGYTRAAEREADVQGLRLLRDAGISNAGLANFFKRVAEMEGESKDDDTASARRYLDVLRTHPPTAEREDMIRRELPYPATPALDAQAWGDLLRVCRQTEPG